MISMASYSADGLMNPTWRSNCAESRFIAISERCRSVVSAVAIVKECIRGVGFEVRLQFSIRMPTVKAAMPQAASIAELKAAIGHEILRECCPCHQQGQSRE